MQLFLRNRVSLSIFMICTMLVLAALPASTVVAKPARNSSSQASWWWDGRQVVGSSKLNRGKSGINARFQATGLPAGQAVTLWYIIFNNPAGCATSPCSVPADVFNPDAEADFLWGGGHVVGASGNATFAGRLKVGDTSGSGMNEIGFPELAIGLTDPNGAEVLLALHSHGPALTGQALKDQLTSYTGGCDLFVGPDGFAAGPSDVPDQIGECSTIQRSLHQP